MYACPFKLTRTRSVKTSISDNFLVCGSILVHDTLFWSCWPNDSFKIILVSIRRPEKVRPKPLKCMDFRVETLKVQIEWKSCCCDRVNLRTHVNAFLCQSVTHNKLGPKTLNVHRFPCQNAQSSNWVQVVSSRLCWLNDSYECIFMLIGCPEQIGTENPKCAQISVSRSIFGFLVLQTPMHVMNGM